MNPEKLQVHPDVIHPDVQAVLDEYSVTPAEYHLLESGVIFNDNINGESELSFGFLDDEEEEDGDRLEIFTENRNIFIEEEIGPIIQSKRLTASRFREVGFVPFGLDIEYQDEIIPDLQTLGLNLEAISAWQLVTAIQTGEFLYESMEVPPRLGVALAAGVQVTENEEQLSAWYTIALYALGKEIYEGSRDLYDEVGVQQVNANMHELLSAAFEQDAQVGKLVDFMWDRRMTPIDVTKRLVSMVHMYPTEEFQPDPQEEAVHPNILRALEEHNVSWGELMFTYGGSVLSRLSPVHFQFGWFAEILQEDIAIIGQAKKEKADINLNQVSELLGYTAGDNITFSHLEEEALFSTFKSQMGIFSLEDPQSSAYWLSIAKLANVPYLITESCYAKSYIMYSYVLALRHKVNRVGVEEFKKRVKANDVSFVAPETLVDDILAVAPEALAQLSNPEVAEIFAEVETGLSIDRTRERIEGALAQAQLLHEAELEAAAARMRRALPKRK